MKFFLLLLIFFVQTIKTKKNLLRIIGGRNATENEFPYVVTLSMSSSTQSKKRICSSIVLTSRWTLTAAHCVTEIETALLFDASGLTKAFIEYNPSPKSELAFSEILRTTAHPSYDSKSKNDIGLLYTHPVIVIHYAKLSPLDYSSLIGQEVFLVGYGMVNSNFIETSTVPQVLEVVVKDCRDVLVWDIYPQICFAPRCSKAHAERSVCPGDSGGPTIHPSGIIAVNSFALYADCGLSPGVPLLMPRFDKGFHIGFSVPVSPFIDWISSIIEREV